MRGAVLPGWGAYQRRWVNHRGSPLVKRVGWCVVGCGALGRSQGHAVDECFKRQAETTDFVVVFMMCISGGTRGACHSSVLEPRKSVMWGRRHYRRPHIILKGATQSDDTTFQVAGAG